ncbi:MAG: CHASE3 domain-containing protein, partial [Verrucomicrobiota bacterium]
MKTNTERAVMTAFFIAALLVGLVSWFEYQASTRMEKTSASVTHTVSVLDALDSLLSSYLDAETGSRGFIITRDEKFLAPYQVALENIPRKLSLVHSLVKENSIQSANLKRVEATGD